jgi:L-lactate dehydrogenase complex protein LldF
VGAVLTPLLVGINRAKDLCLGETLCGACQDACAVNIDLPRMLLALRAKLAEGDPAWQVAPADRSEKLIWQAWSRIIRKRTVYDGVLRLAALAQKLLPRRNGMIRRLPPPVNGWTQGRDLRPLAKESFIRRWNNKLS